jgi:Uma2 family endonuclease
MGNPASAPDERFTYRHYKTWPDSERWELIEGRAWAMMESYGRRHQETIGSFLCLISDIAGKKNASLIHGPFDVLLPLGDEPVEEIGTIVQPDFSVYLDRAKVCELYGKGPPDLVVEVVNPRTAKKDYNDKFRLYEARGVVEYWIVDPFCCSIHAYTRCAKGRFTDGKISELIYGGGPIESCVLSGFAVDPKELFADLN